MHGHGVESTVIAVIVRCLKKPVNPVNGPPPRGGRRSRSCDLKPPSHYYYYYYYYSYSYYNYRVEKENKQNKQKRRSENKMVIILLLLFSNKGELQNHKPGFNAQAK
jgi:hypothetical protein